MTVTEDDTDASEPAETTTTLVEALQMENISLDTTNSTPATPEKEKPSSPLGGSFVVEDEELKGALVDELRNGRPELKTNPDSLHAAVYHSVEMIY